VSKKTDGVMEHLYKPELMNVGRHASNQAQNQFNDLYRMYHNQLTELCVNRFDWQGLPPEIDPRFLEMTLFRNALSVFYYDNRYERFLSLRGSSAGAWNMYDNPTGFQVVGNAFVGRYIPASHCVPIWANYTRRPDTDIVRIYARKLANLDLTIEINSDNARRGKVFAIPENQKLSAQNYVDQINRGEPIIFVNSAAFDPTADGSLTALDLGVNPDTIINLDILHARVWGRVMGLLGIDNANQDKRERLVAAEVQANDGQVENMRRVNLNAREQACQQINDMFGLNVSVRFHVDGEDGVDDGVIDGVIEPDGDDNPDSGDGSQSQDNEQKGEISGNFHRRAIQGR
jgi:hypothetical protein